MDGGQSEKEIERDILSFLRSHPLVLFARSNSQGASLKWYRNLHKSLIGFPDIDGLFKRGKGPFYIEVKKPGGVFSTEQTQFLKALESQGYRVLRAFSVEEVIQWLSQQTI